MALTPKHGPEGREECTAEYGAWFCGFLFGGMAGEVGGCRGVGDSVILHCPLPNSPYLTTYGSRSVSPLPISAGYRYFH